MCGIKLLRIEICLIYDSRVILEEMWRDLLQRMNFP